MRTWLNLYRLLDGAGVDLRKCFFTNIYVGLVAGLKPVGRFPGARDVDFTRWCDAFLRRQIERMRPRAIVPLGGEARRHFGWPDREPGIVDIDGRPTTYVCLAHPSMHPANVRARSGVEGEITRLRTVASGA